MSKNEGDSKAQDEKRDDGVSSPRVEELKRLIASTGDDPLPEAKIIELEGLEDQLTEIQDYLSALRDQEMLSEDEFSTKLNLSFESFIGRAAALLGADLCRKIYDFVPGEKITIARQDEADTQRNPSEISSKAITALEKSLSDSAKILERFESAMLVKEKSIEDILKDTFNEVERLQKEADFTSRRIVSGEIKDVDGAMVAVEKADVFCQKFSVLRKKFLVEKLREKEAL